MGVVTGQMLVDGRQRDTGFQRKTGYVQQQDLHLSTSTVREALVFSALLRQPESVPKHEKLAYVDEVINVLEMVSGLLWLQFNMGSRSTEAVLRAKKFHGQPRYLIDGCDRSPIHRQCFGQRDMFCAKPSNTKPYRFFFWRCECITLLGSLKRHCACDCVPWMAPFYVP